MDNRVNEEIVRLETVIDVIDGVLEEVIEEVFEEDVEYKVYKEKPYLNSDRDPLGISLNGKSKEYIHAHESIKKVLKKGKQYSFDKGNMKILDVTFNKAMTNAIIEVNVQGESKGNVEVKVHRPSVHKKKGATIEIRKMSGFDYDHVLILRSIIISLLDNFIIGNDINQILKTNKKGISKKTVAKVTSNPTLFACDLCKWQTRFPSALKSHKTRIHSVEHVQVKPFKCDICIFTAKEKAALNVHKESTHKGSKRSKMDKNVDDSPASSPPRKKENVDLNEKDDSDEMMDIEMEANDVVLKMLENKIKELESTKDDLEKEIDRLKLKQNEKDKEF